MSAKVKRKKENPNTVVGSWINGDEYDTDVEYVVTRAGEGFAVHALDRFDGEEGVVYDVRYQDGSSTLSFDVQWKSTGRFINVRLQPISPNRASYTYTFTETQMWFRKGTEATTAVKPSRQRRHGKTP